MSTGSGRPGRVGGGGSGTAFVEAAERLFFGGRVQIGKAVRPAKPLPMPARRQAILRATLSGLARRSPEVMVKISGASRDLSRLRAHLRYISRRGGIELEDQDGSRHDGLEAVTEVLDDWQSAWPIPAREARAEPSAGDRAQVSSRRPGRREAFHIVLSMPAGTPPEQLIRAARDFAAETFAGHDYVMALHTAEVDPDPVPSPHPHVHLTVKARSRAGRRLNPRKADLARWREGFAECLRARGIDAVATPRQVRGQRQPGLSQANAQMSLRGAAGTRKARRVPAEDAVARNEATARRVQEDWEVVLAGRAALEKSAVRDAGPRRVSSASRTAEVRRGPEATEDPNR